MDRNEMIEILMEKVNISREEAVEVLEKCNFDLLDAIVYLERQGKVENNNETKIIEVKEEKKNNHKKDKENFGGIGEITGRIFRFIVKLIRKGNENYFEIRKENEKPIKISLTISALLLVLGFWIVGIILIVGLFCGYKYSISGPSMNYNRANDILERVSESAGNIKRDFKEGYEK